MQSERLKLKPISPEDVAALHALWNEPDVRRHLWENDELSLEDVQAIVERSQEMHASSSGGLWRVESRENDSEGELIGFGGFWNFGEEAESGDKQSLQILFGLAPQHWGMGLATELARCLIEYGFDTLGMERIRGATESSNVSSQRVMEKAGMKVDERVRSGGRDTTYYAIQRH